MLRLRPFFYLFLTMFSLFSCFKKKPSHPENIEAWLEATFPGQLVVVVNNWNFDVMNLFVSGKKIAVVADKSDPEVQFTLAWHKPAKNETGLGLDSTEVKARLDTCRADVQRARELHRQLKQHGLQQFSVSSIQSAAYILVFAEPTPIARQQITSAVIATLDARKEQPQTRFWIEIMEPQFYHTEFQDIVPHSEWQKPGTVFTGNKIMSLNFEWKKGLSVTGLKRGWALNEMAERCSNYIDDAYPKALAWGEKNLPKPFYLEPTQMVHFDLEKTPLGNDEADLLTIQLGFPYFKTKPAEADDIEPEGLVTGIYNVDDKSFSKMKRSSQRSSPR